MFGLQQLQWKHMEDLQIKLSVSETSTVKNSARCIHQK